MTLSRNLFSGITHLLHLSFAPKEQHVYRLKSLQVKRSASVGCRSKLKYHRREVGGLQEWSVR